MSAFEKREDLQAHSFNPLGRNRTFLGVGNQPRIGFEETVKTEAEQGGNQQLPAGRVSRERDLEVRFPVVRQAGGT